MHSSMRIKSGSWQNRMEWLKIKFERILTHKNISSPSKSVEPQATNQIGSPEIQPGFLWFILFSNISKFDPFEDLLSNWILFIFKNDYTKIKMKWKKQTNKTIGAVVRFSIAKRSSNVYSFGCFIFLFVDFIICTQKCCCECVIDLCNDRVLHGFSLNFTKMGIKASL